MADTKITALTAISTVDPAVDVLPIVDVSDTTMAASGTTKKITSNQILGAGGTATLASATITGDLTVDTSTLKVSSSTDTVCIGATTTDAKFRVVDASYNGLRIGFLPGTSNYNLYDATVHEFRTANVTPQQLYTLQASSSVWYDGAGGTRMTLNSTGLGVGVVPTAGRLHIKGGSSQSPLVLDTLGYNQIVLQLNGANRGQIYADATNCFALVDSTGSNLRLVVTDTGNVGVGVTPSAWRNTQKALQIGAVGAYFSSAASTGSTCIGRNVYESAAGNFTYIVNDEATLYEQSATGVHAWYTAAASTGTIAFTQAMTLDASGNLLVGKAASNFATAGGEFRSNGEVIQSIAASTSGTIVNKIYSTTAAAYRFYVDMAGTVFATNTTISAISDARLKENVQDIDVGLGAILALKPRKFDWKEGKGKDIKGDRGFIAQEFEQVFPQLVDEWKDAAPEGEAPYKSVRQDLIPVLVKAIQELAAEVNALKNA